MDRGDLPSPIAITSGTTGQNNSSMRSVQSRISVGIASPPPAVNRRVDPQLPRTWHRDLTYARDVLRGDTPLGVLWVNEIRSNSNSIPGVSSVTTNKEKNITTCYRLVILSKFRLYVTNGKTGLMSEMKTNAHLFDLERINVIQGDRIEFYFKRLNLIIEDTVGPALVTAVWTALGEISYQVPISRLPKLDRGARNLIDTDIKLNLQQTTSKATAFIYTYQAACDHLGVKPKACIEQYILSTLDAHLEEKGNKNIISSPLSSPKDLTENKESDSSIRIFDLSAAMRGDNTHSKENKNFKMNDNDLPALARALSVTTHFDALALSGMSPNNPSAPVITLSTEGARSLLHAIDSAPRMRRLLLVGVGLTATKIDKVDAPNAFKKITHLNLTDNQGLGTKGLCKILGSDTLESSNNFGPEKLQRLECRGCGYISKNLPLKKNWQSSLIYLDMTRCDLSKVNDSFYNFLKNAKVLEILIIAHCGLVLQHLLAVLTQNKTLCRDGILRVLDVSLNKCATLSSPSSMQPPMDEIGKAFLGTCIHLEKLFLSKCDISVPFLEQLLKGLDLRSKQAVSYSTGSVKSTTNKEESFPMPLSLNLADNALDKKHGSLFYDHLSQSQSVLRQLNLDRSYMGTLALRDLFAALANSKAPHLTILSLRCTASKGGLFANKRKHEDMARALAEVILKCTALERLILSGGDGSHFKQDLLPAMAALASNNNLKVLDISNNLCGDESIHALAGSLATNESLTKLMIDGNSASGIALRALADSLQRNLNIYSCDLPRKDIALASRNLPTDHERTELAKTMKDIKQAINRNAVARAAKGGTTEMQPSEHPRASSTSSTPPYRISFSSTRGYHGAAYASFFSNFADRDDGDDDDDDDDDDGDGTTNGLSNDVAVRNEIDHDGNQRKVQNDDDIQTGENRSSLNIQDQDTNFTGDEKNKRSPPAPPPKSATTNENIAHRMKIFEEILETETNYVRDLGVICHSFLIPIEKRELLKRDEIDKVFGNVSELRRIHEELLAKLRAAHRRHNDVVFAGKSSAQVAATDLARVHAHIFAEMIPFLRAYTVYCSTYTKAVELVRQLSSNESGTKNTKFSKFLQISVQSPQCRGLDLASFLIKPPQRLCKYPLFFRDLLKHMGNSAADRESANLISKTLDAVQDVTNAVNQNMASSGSQARVFEIFKNELDSHESVADLVSPTRRFLLEGIVDFASHDKAPKRHQFYLFNDLLLLATPRRGITGADVPNKFKIKHRFALVDVAITDAPACISLNDNDHNFLIRFEDQGGGSNSVHWGSHTTSATTTDSGLPSNNTNATNTTGRPARADFLLWCDDASQCERIRNTIQQACYDIRVLHEDIQNRRKSVLPIHHANTSSSVKQHTGIEPDASDNEDNDEQNSTTSQRWHGTAHLDLPNHSALDTVSQSSSNSRPPNSKPPPPPPQKKTTIPAPAIRPPPPADDAQRSVTKVTRMTEM